MKIKLIPRILLGIFVVIGLVVIIILSTGLWKKEMTEKEELLQVKEVESSEPLAKSPELSETAKKRRGLIGPFPVGEDIPEPERQIGRVMNAWRETIISRRIEDIKRLRLGIKRYGQEAIPFLRQLVLEDKNERIRAFATRVLGQMKKTKLISLFIDLLQKDTSPFVRIDAAWALGELGNLKSVSILQMIADSDESERVRQSAQKALKSIEEINRYRKEGSRGQEKR